MAAIIPTPTLAKALRNSDIETLEDVISDDGIRPSTLAQLPAAPASNNEKPNIGGHSEQ